MASNKISQNSSTTISAAANSVTSGLIATKNPYNSIGLVSTVSVEERPETPKYIQVYEITQILSVNIGEDGYFETELKLDRSIISDSNYKIDGWPIYIGSDDWGFVVEKKKLSPQLKPCDHSTIKIKAKQPIYIGQNFAFLNQFDNNFQNEEIIETVKEVERQNIIYAKVTPKYLNDWATVAAKTTICDSTTIPF